MEARPGIPMVTGLSPKEGVPGTQITIRGENLGTDPSDLVALIICGTDCLVSAKWKSPSKIVARLGRAKRGVGDVILVTKSGGRGVSNVQFRVFIEQVGPLQESSVWVDESRTVPGRNAVRTVAETTEEQDALGLKVDPQKKLDSSVLSKIFPDASGNRRMESFSTAWYLLENHKHTRLPDLRQGLKHMQSTAARDAKSAKDLHKANLYSLVNCVDALTALHSKIQVEKNTRGWPLSTNLSDKIEESKLTADKLFREVLGRKDRADATRNALSVLTRFRFIFFLPQSINENMSKGDYSTILNDYTRAKALFKDSEVSLFKEVMTVLDEKIELLKDTIKHKLIDAPTSFEEQSKLIKYLKILDPNSDPAWDCITAYHCWLEEMLWQLQRKYHQLAVEEEVQRRDEGLTPDGGTTQRQAFITELLSLLTDKLQSFWKLAQSYSGAIEDNYAQKTEDINQMLTNTINVSSWLLLNALVPSSLPESVTTQYKDQFVKWPNMSTKTQMNNLFFALKLLRTCIKSLMEHQFSRSHVQPLIELCMTVRLKCLGIVVDRTTEAVLNLGAHENWRIDGVNGQSRTSLPDLFEAEINKILENTKQILSFTGYPGEADLFAKERTRQIITELFIMVIGSLKECYERLLQLKTDQKRPNKLIMPNAETASVSSANEGERQRLTQEVTSRKLLVAICNIEYVLNHSLAAICKRLSDNGVKYAELILEKSRQKLVSFRQSLVKRYLTMKMATLHSLIESISYENLDDEYDASFFIKELVMGVVFVQAELRLLAPQLTSQILSAVVEAVMNRIIEVYAEMHIGNAEQATNVVVDLASLEEAFQTLLFASTRRNLNSVRRGMTGRLDEERFQCSLKAFRETMRMAISSLQVDAGDPSQAETSQV